MFILFSVGPVGPLWSSLFFQILIKENRDSFHNGPTSPALLRDKKNMHFEFRPLCVKFTLVALINMPKNLHFNGV